MAGTFRTRSTATTSLPGCRSQTNADGSLDIWIGAASPRPDKEANWLPAPKSGPFNLTVRIFLPDEAMLDGTYELPPVMLVK